MSVEDYTEESKRFDSETEIDYDNPTASFEDLLAEEDEPVGGPAKAVKLRTGIGSSKAAKPREREGVDPNAVRWLFSPFEIIDLRNEGAGCGFDYLPNVVFQEVKSIPTTIRKPDPFNIASDPTPDGRGHNEENYERFVRTAYMIMLELVAKNGDKGVIDVTELTGQDSDKAEALNQLLFGEEIHCVEDVNNPDHPVPVLPTLLESLEANVRAAMPKLDPGTQMTVRLAARRVREAISLAMRNARARINEAQKRLNDEKSPNRILSHSEERCYRALGEEIPNQMPFLTKTAAKQINAGGVTIDAEALGRGIAQGLAGAGVQPQAQAAAASAAPSTTKAIPATKATGAVGNNSPNPADFSVSEQDIADAESNSGEQAATPPNTKGGGKRTTK